MRSNVLPKSSRRDIRAGSVATGSFNFLVVDWNHLRFDYNVMADFSLKLGIQVADIIVPHKDVSPLLADKGVVNGVFTATSAKRGGVWDAPSITQAEGVSKFLLIEYITMVLEWKDGQPTTRSFFFVQSHVSFHIFRHLFKNFCKVVCIKNLFVFLQLFDGVGLFTEIKKG